MDKRERDYKAEWQRIKNDPEALEAQRAYLRDWREQHLEKERERSRKKYAANKEYYNRKTREWYAAHKDKWKNEYVPRRQQLHRERDNAAARERHKQNPEIAREKGRRRRNGPNRAQYLKILRYQMHKHYLSREKYDEIYPKLLTGPCDICGGDGRMMIDHCHRKNVFRGVLCDNCNRGIGHLKDNPATLRKAAEYLERDVTG